MLIQDIIVFDEDINHLGTVSDYSVFQTQESYYNSGIFKLICNLLPENVQLLQPNRFLFRAGGETAFLVQEVVKDTQTKSIYVYGCTTLELLTQRGVLQTEKITNVEQGLINIVNNNIRGLKRVTVATPKGIPDTITHETTYGEVLETLETFCMESKIGHRMIFDIANQLHIYTPYKGVDRSHSQNTNPPELFDENLGGLDHVKQEYSLTDLKNVAYVLGAGEGTQREIVVVGSAFENNRYELMVDARNMQQEEEETLEAYRNRLYWHGVEALSKYNEKLVITVEIDDTKIDKSVFLGDVVTIQSQTLNIKVNARIISKIINEDKNGKVYKIDLSEFEFI